MDVTNFLRQKIAEHDLALGKKADSVDARESYLGKSTKEQAMVIGQMQNRITELRNQIDKIIDL